MHSGQHFHFTANFQHYCCYVIWFYTVVCNALWAGPKQNYSTMQYFLEIAGV